MKKTIEVVKIEYKKEGRTFEFWLEGKLKETDNSFQKLLLKVKKYKLDWSPKE